MVPKFGRISQGEHGFGRSLAHSVFEGRLRPLLRLRVRVCQGCGNDFVIERKRGKPRSWCFECQPAGYKMTKVRGRLKLRRWPPMLPPARVLPRHGGWAA